MSPHRRLTPLLIALTLVRLALVGAPAPSHAGAELPSAPERGAVLATTVHVESGVVARAVRHPEPSGSFASARGLTTVVAAPSHLDAFVPLVTARTPLYALFRVYRL